VQHPLARLRGYADVRFGLAGGNLRLRGLSVAEAERVRAAVLDSMAANDFSQIGEATPTGC
jgi:putative membrane protein